MTDQKPKLLKRILCESCDGVYDGTEAQSIASCPAIVFVPPASEDIDPRDLQDICIPYARFWIEGTVKLRTEPASTEPDPLALWGVLFVVEDWGSVYSVRHYVFHSFGPFKPCLVGVVKGRVSKEGRIEPLQLDEQVGTFQILPLKLPGGFLADMPLDTIAQTVLHAYRALSYLGCKNIRLQAHDHEPATTRKLIKRLGEGEYKYHTLVVRPIGSSHSDNSATQQVGVMPLHMCRGHFAEYGEKYGKGKLFGRYEGRFYVTPHVKGDRKNGIVDKDYVVGKGGDNE